jgi:hypothetical protein
MELIAKEIGLYLVLGISLAMIAVSVLFTIAVLVRHILERHFGQVVPLTQMVSIYKQNIRGFLIEWFFWVVFLIPLIILIVRHYNLHEYIYLPIVLFLIGFFGGRLFEFIKKHIVHYKRSRTNEPAQIEKER